MDLKSPKSLILVACDSLLASQTLAWGLECHLPECDLSYVCVLEELIQRFHAEGPRLVLLDEGMALRSVRILSGLIAIRTKQARVAVLGDELTRSQVNYIVHNRVSGLLSRRRTLPDFARDLNQVLNNKAFVAEHLNEGLLVNSDGFVSAEHDIAQPLSDRQLQVLIRIAQGASVREVAQELRISEKSVESHKYRAMKVLHIDDRVDLCRWAIREGLIQA